METQTEEQIIQDAKHDPIAFGRLYDEHYDSVYGYILKRVADPATAQDIVAETFLKAYLNIHRFKWKGVSIGNWFYKIATNELRQYFRKNKYAPHSLEVLFETSGFEPISDIDLAEEQMRAQREIARRQAFLDAQKLLITLPLKYQEVLMLRFVEKKKISEIALILNKREGTIKSLLSRGLSQIRKKLAPIEMQLNPLASIIRNEVNNISNPIETVESYEE